MQAAAISIAQSGTATSSCSRGTRNRYDMRELYNLELDMAAVGLGLSRAPISTSLASLPRYGICKGDGNSVAWGKRSRRRGGCQCTGASNGDEEEGAEDLGRQKKGFDMNEELGRVLGDEETKALLKELAAAVQRVEAAKREMELSKESQYNAAIQEVQAQEALIEECAEEVIAAKAEVRAAEIALISARAGESNERMSSKWESGSVDEEVERIESGRAALVSAVTGVCVSLPLVLIQCGGIGVSSLISEGVILVSCAAFGVTYRYIIRKDLGNLQLKAGSAAGFALVRGLAQVDATRMLVGFPEAGSEQQLLVAAAATYIGQSLIIFFSATLALDFCLQRMLLNPFPSSNKQKK